MMHNKTIGRSLVSQSRPESSLPTTGRRGSANAMTRAANVRNVFNRNLSSAHARYQRNKPDRGAFSVQLPQRQPPNPEQSSYDLGLNSPAHKPYQLMGDSHTRPANSRLAAYGCYRVVGPARISKRGDTLIAYLFRGSRIELLDRDGNAALYGSTESMTEEELVASGGSSSGGDECCVGECELVAAHVELCGSACSVDLVELAAQPGVHHHNGHTYLSVRSLPPEAVIDLDAGSALRHPINITPTSP